jgi:hypothetical protein
LDIERKSRKEIKKRLISPLSKEAKCPISLEGWQFQILLALFLQGERSFQA